MSGEQNQSPIHKKKILSLQLPKSHFTTPKANRYFQKIVLKKGILASSCQQIKPLQKIQQKSVLLNRSASLQISKRQTQMDKGKVEPRESKSLPKIKNKKMIQQEIGKEIMSSELGYLNFYQILQLKNKTKNLTYKLSNATRTSSYISEQEGNQIEKHSLNQTEAEKNYDEYDKILMQKQPVIYKRKYFRLKHKAEWGVSR